jgi:hypothetical protein
MSVKIDHENHIPAELTLASFLLLVLLRHRLIMVIALLNLFLHLFGDSVLRKDRSISLLYEHRCLQWSWFLPDKLLIYQHLSVNLPQFFIYKKLILLLMILKIKNLLVKSLDA